MGRMKCTHRGCETEISTYTKYKLCRKHFRARKDIQEKYKKSLSEGTKRTWKDERVRERRLKGIENYLSKPENVKRLRDQLQTRWTNERRKRQSQRMKEHWAKYREKYKKGQRLRINSPLAKLKAQLTHDQLQDFKVYKSYRYPMKEIVEIMGLQEQWKKANAE